jgi:hypothetical protein
MIMRFHILFYVALLLAVSTQAQAKGPSPYLPLKISPEIEVKIEKLLALTRNVPLTKPYKASEILSKLTQVKDSHPLLHSQLTAYISRYTKPAGITHVELSASYNDDTSKALPNQRNINADSNYQGSIGALAYITPYAYVSLGTTYADDAGVIHTNTHLGFGYEYAQVELGYREHWFSPFQDSAVLLSTHAISSPSITVSNATPITKWNLRYEVFYSILEEQSGIVLGDQVTPGRPRIAGIHLSAAPLDFWTIGVNRTLQFGGGLRDPSVSDVFQAIFNPAGIDNVGDIPDVVADDPNFEFGNQLASFTSKINFTWYTPISFYGEIGGEDTEGESNFKLGNETLSAGLFLPEIRENLALRYEFTRWSTAWYVHPLYAEGYSNEGQVLGHFGGGERVFNDDTPSKTHSFNADWTLASGHIINATYRIINNETSDVFDYFTANELQLRYSRPTRYGFFGAEVYVGNNVFGDRFGRISAFYRW